MKRLIFLALLVVLATASQAQQSIQAYVSAGALLSQVEGDELKGFNHLGFTGGVGAWIHLDQNDRWSLAVETDYSGRGISNHKSASDNYYNIQLNLHYVDIPVTLFYHDPFGGIQVGVGLLYSRLVSQPHGVINYNPNYFVPDTTDMSFLKNDLAPAIEIRFSVWKNLKMSIRYQRSIIAVKKDWTFQMAGETWSNDCYNSSVSMRLLWQFGDEDSRPHRKRRRR